MPKLYGEEVVYKYEELDSFAQDRALEAWSIDQVGWDYDDEPERTYIGEILTCLGFNLTTHGVQLMNKIICRDYSFWCDYDSAGEFTFGASYAYRAGWRSMWKKCAYYKPDDPILELGLRLQKLQKKYAWKLEGEVSGERNERSFRHYDDPPIQIKHRDGEYQSEWYDDDGPKVADEDYKEFQQIVIELCDWAWDILHCQWEWTGSRERAEGPDGEFEQMNYYFSEDGRESYFDLKDDELEEYVEEDY